MGRRSRIEVMSMERPHQPTPENESELRDRLSRLSQASLRINESLDFDTVLQGALDAARSLTGARYGVMTLLDDGGRVQDSLSSGMAGDEAERLWLTPSRWQLFEVLTNVSAPLRIPDLVEHVRTLGIAGFTIPMPVGQLFPFLAAPMFHRGARVGHIFLGDREGGEEFSQADEETLVMFASQAALVIANAGAYREERRARADLETLVNTSPVGVVVFDAETGAPTSFNREARRIADSLRERDQTPEMLLDVITCRRADGREVSLREFPLAELLRAAETLRAEEVVLRAPDGRSVTALLNATPILSDAGAVESMVVTLQDMAAVEELERMRAEFLAMVSHELRAPLTSIKGSAATAAGVARRAGPGGGAPVLPHHRGAGRPHARPGLRPAGRGPHRDRHAAGRSRAGGGGRAGGPGTQRLHQRRGQEQPRHRHRPGPALALADRRRIVQVLGNLLSNAARHSSQSSLIRVSAVRAGVHVAVSVADEGRGIPAESLPHLFRKFSRIQSEEQGGDTGLGLAICKGIVEAHGGRIWAESDGPGLGARFTFTLPAVADAGSAARRGRPSAAARSSGRGRGETGERVRVLAVDDDPQDLRYVRDALIRSGYAPTVTGDPGEALRLVEEERPHLVLLDVVLPGSDGIELMEAMLATADVPVIFLSAYSRDDLIARALNMGAADYVVKPFSPTELSARIAAALRRREVPDPEGPYLLGELTVDFSERRVSLGGRPLRLRPLEYRLLAELSAGAGRVLTYAHLLERVWGERGSRDLRPMRTVVRKLRRKLGDDAANPTYIFTEPRVGYRMPKGEGAEANRTKP